MTFKGLWVTVRAVSLKFEQVPTISVLSKNKTPENPITRLVKNPYYMALYFLFLISYFGGESTYFIS